VNAPAGLPRDAVLSRAPFVRLHHCAVRGRWLLLAPERVLYPCPTTVTVLERLAAGARFGEIVEDFARRYDAPAEDIAADLSDLLTPLIEKGYVRRDHD